MVKGAVVVDQGNSTRSVLPDLVGFPAVTERPQEECSAKAICEKDKMEGSS